MELKDQVALITGGGDVAAAALKRFLAEGAKVVLVVRKIRDTLQKALDEAGNQERVKIIMGDVCKLADMENAAAQTAESFGRIDILFTTAGVIRHNPIDVMTFEDWKLVMDTNVDGVFNASKAVVPFMKKQEYGRIIHVSSLAGRTGRPGVGVNYAASKAAVIGLTQTLAVELSSFNITVNSVSPGPLDGAMFVSASKETVEKLKSNIPLKRLGKPEEVAGCAVFLAGKDAGWITGEVLDMNGGIYL